MCRYDVYLLVLNATIDNRIDNFMCNLHYGHVMQMTVAMAVSNCTRATVMSALCFPRCQEVPSKLVLLRRGAKWSLKLSVGL